MLLVYQRERYRKCAPFHAPKAQAGLAESPGDNFDNVLVFFIGQKLCSCL